MGEKQSLYINAKILGEPERRTLNNQEHLVIPVVAAKEGVMNGFFYPSEQLANSVKFWEDVPVPVNHPQRNGKFISARSTSIEDRQNIGRFYNVKFDDNKLKGEIWINIEKANRLGFEDIVKSLESGEMMEVSTGLISDVIPSIGEFNNERFIGVIEDIRPDHLALLQNEEGACSIKDGCGAMRVNCECKATKKEKILNAFKEVGNFLSSFKDDELINNKYSTDEKTEEVAESLEDSQNSDSEVVGNRNNLTEEKVMSKDELVLAIIANKSNSFTESDSESLKGQDDEFLKKFISNEEEQEEVKQEESNEEEKADGEESQESEAPAEEASEGKEEEVTANLDQKVDSIISSVEDKEVVEFLTNAVKKQKEEKEGLIKDILTNSKLSEQFLRNQSLEDLGALKASLKPKANYSVRGIQGNSNAKQEPRKGILGKHKK